MYLYDYTLNAFFKRETMFHAGFFQTMLQKAD